MTECKICGKEVKESGEMSHVYQAHCVRGDLDKDSWKEDYNALEEGTEEEDAEPDTPEVEGGPEDVEPVEDAEDSRELEILDAGVEMDPETSPQAGEPEDVGEPESVEGVIVCDDCGSENVAEIDGEIIETARKAGASQKDLDLLEKGSYICRECQGVME